MDIRLEPISPEDREPVIDIFNYYVENSFAAYLENKVPYEAFDMLMKMAQGYPTVAVKDSNRQVLGFGMLRAYNPMPAFSQTVEISYFIKPEHRGKGLGTSMLDYLVNEAKKQNITSILASISSLNEESLAFHSKKGFQEVGRFRNIGVKNGVSFDVVWMQKMILT
jgi:phosphinothricin acetyltransferase